MILNNRPDGIGQNNLRSIEIIGIPTIPNKIILSKDS